ncbi:hypothetical protein niasHT_040001 [Heterodera trifolii]|uniref:Uncharacterized protein n=1 Tax=Heterodera trifolii TaxID=157864 RepID=A0ABD2J294_9BILA
MIKNYREGKCPKKALAPLPLCPPAHLSVPFRFFHSVRPLICPCHSVFSTLSARSFVRAIPFFPLCPPAHLSVPFRFFHSVRLLICPCHSVFSTLSACSFVRAIPFFPLCPPALLVKS